MARLTYGLTMPDAPIAVVDLGGGSTVVVVGRPEPPPQRVE